MEIRFWNIHSSDGRYVGQSKTFAPQTAFCQCMLILGKQIAESEVAVEELSDGSYRITHESGDFVLTPRP